LRNCLLYFSIRELIVETQPQLQPALLRLSAMISQYLTLKLCCSSGLTTTLLERFVREVADKFTILHTGTALHPNYFARLRADLSSGVSQATLREQ
jgi:hypothetical protein